MNRHLTDQEISRWISGDRLPGIRRHALECRDCGAQIETVEQALSLFRESGRRWSEHCCAPTPAPVRHPLRWAVALAASLLVAAILLRPVPVKPDAPPLAASADEQFLPIPYTPPMAPYERVSMVRMDVPVSALIAAGFEVHMPDVGASVRADVLFGQDGRAVAIRLVSDRTPQFQ